MATKKATVYVLAVGSDMGSDLEDARSTLFSLLLAKVREQNSQDQVAVFLAGSTVTRYRGMLSDSSYQSVYQLWPPGDAGYSGDTPLMANATVDLLRMVNSAAWESASQSDVIGAIAWGIDAVIEHCRKLKYEKLVRVITNAHTIIDEGLIAGIVEQAIAQGIVVDIVGAGFSDPTDDEANDASIPPAQPLLFSISDPTGGRFFSDAIPAIASLSSIALHQPSSRPYGPTFLTLGDRDREDSVVRFPVQFVVKVKSAELPKPTKLSIPALEMKDEEDDDWGDLVGGTSSTKSTSVTAPLPPIDLVKVQMASGFRAADDSGNADPNDATVYDSNAITSAYHYGKSLVTMGDWEKDPVSNDGTVGLMVIAFVPVSSIRRDMFLSSTRYVVPNIKFESADIRLAALVSIMRTRGLAAIARYVYNARSSAKLVGLFAHTPKSGPTCGLLMTGLPTSFDCHRVSYMSLLTDEMANLVVPDAALSGPDLLKPRLPARFTPTIEQRQTMAVFVGNSFLVGSDEEEDEPGENELDVERHESSNTKYDRESMRAGSELLEPKSVSHPTLQRIHAAIEEALFDSPYPDILPPLSSKALAAKASQPAVVGSDMLASAAPLIAAIPGMQRPSKVWKRQGFDQVLGLLHSTHKTVKVEKTASKRKTNSEQSNLDGTAIRFIAQATGNTLLMPQSQVTNTDGGGSQAKRPRLQVSRSQPLLSKTRWRQDYAKAIGAQDADHVQQAMFELADIANMFMEGGHVDEARQCIEVMRNSVDTVDAQVEWNEVLEAHRKKGSMLMDLLT